MVSRVCLLYEVGVLSFSRMPILPFRNLSAITCSSCENLHTMNAPIRFKPVRSCFSCNASCLFVYL